MIHRTHREITMCDHRFQSTSLTIGENNSIITAAEITFKIHFKKKSPQKKNIKCNCSSTVTVFMSLLYLISFNSPMNGS